MPTQQDRGQLKVLVLTRLLAHRRPTARCREESGTNPTARRGYEDVNPGIDIRHTLAATVTLEAASNLLTTQKAGTS